MRTQQSNVHLHSFVEGTSINTFFSCTRTVQVMWIGDQKAYLREAFERNVRTVDLTPDNVPDINVITGRYTIQISLRIFPPRGDYYVGFIY